MNSLPNIVLDWLNPHIWLYQPTNYTKVGNVDTQSLLFMFKDHAKKTVTVEAHPHLPMTMASVHPCRWVSIIISLLIRIAILPTVLVHFVLFSLGEFNFNRGAFYFDRHSMRCVANTRYIIVHFPQIDQHFAGVASEGNKVILDFVLEVRKGLRFRLHL